MTLHSYAHLKRVFNPSFLLLLYLRSHSCSLSLPMMSLDLDIKETSQPSTNHSVAVCKNSTTNQAYCYLSEERWSLQFSAVNTSLRYIGYDEIHFMPFYSRENWIRYHPTVGGPAQTLQLFQTPFISIFVCYNCSSR